MKRIIKRKIILRRFFGIHVFCLHEKFQVYYSSPSCFFLTTYFSYNRKKIFFLQNIYAFTPAQKMIRARLHFQCWTFSFVSVLMGKRQKTAPKWVKFQNWLKTYPKVKNSKSKCLFHHFGEMLAWKSDLRFHFRAPEVPFLGTWKWPLLSKMAHFGYQKNGTSIAQIKILRPLFNTN